MEKENKLRMSELGESSFLRKCEAEAELRLFLYGIVKEAQRESEAITDGKNYTDVNKIAEKKKLEIIEIPMNSEKDIFMDELAGYLDVYDYDRGHNQWSIYINKELGDLSKRYVLAHELAHFMLSDKEVGKARHCMNPYFPLSETEQLCDLMASYILMPVARVLSLLDSFVEKKRQKEMCPINMDEWMQFLAYEPRVSDYHVTQCYQNIRYLGAIILHNEKKCQKYKLNEEYETVEKYSYLFR